MQLAEDNTIKTNAIVQCPRKTFSHIYATACKHCEDFRGTGQNAAIRCAAIIERRTMEIVEE